MTDVCKSFEISKETIQPKNITDLASKLWTDTQKLQSALATYIEGNRFYGSESLLTTLNGCDANVLKTTLNIDSLSRVQKQTEPKEPTKTDWKTRLAHALGVPTAAEQMAKINIASNY